MPPAPDALDLLQPEDPVGEECGVFGVWAPDEDVAKLTYYGLYALQHRGQEAAGMAVSDGSNVLVFKDLGLVAQVFDERSLSSMSGHLAIGHTRYSTTGSGTWENAQPSFRTLETGGSLALGHNGNLTNTSELSALAASLDPRTGEMGATTDSDLITTLLAAQPGRTPARGGARGAADAAGRVLPHVHGRAHALRRARPARRAAAGARPPRPRVGRRQRDGGARHRRRDPRARGRAG